MNFAQARGKKNTKSRQEDSDDHDSNSSSDDNLLDVTKFARSEAISLRDEQGKTLSLRFHHLVAHACPPFILSDRVVAYGVVNDAEPNPEWFKHYDPGKIPDSWRYPHFWPEIHFKSVLQAKRAQTYRFPEDCIFSKDHQDLNDDDLAATELLKASAEDGRSFYVFHQLIEPRYSKKPARGAK